MHITTKKFFYKKFRIFLYGAFPYSHSCILMGLYTQPQFNKKVKNNMHETHYLLTEFPSANKPSELWILWSDNRYDLWECAKSGTRISLELTREALLDINEWLKEDGKRWIVDIVVMDQLSGPPN